jgi:hypothetical protein
MGETKMEDERCNIENINYVWLDEFNEQLDMDQIKTNKK